MLRRSRYVLFFPLNCDGLLSFVLLIDEFALNTISSASTQFATVPALG